jgi:hypothetical protein
LSHLRPELGEVLDTELELEHPAASSVASMTAGASTRVNEVMATGYEVRFPSLRRAQPTTDCRRIGSRWL